ncbi:aminotransferase class V-fold PLP-dependent enzyme [Cyanobacterium aponinum UTEX 3222]|uniref:aminotransferase class V-fold PLP-dependent enzyme n=1 Tax=Cyanobacterium aponinum TaxID=379064 RepID=UPI002B4BD63F|nr:aminotransferase class V-fold PLP-dependent enzyme [Cyanobacterium aponinum]WRL39673.1 aminotransferase class V-fold PLP-dependent enzyme [Cyanobacterium aponinum UTEX 3221]WRL42455.1 aminotransferase class V-fold PLP-dependent enzyme [Cyanobacterium aponinum UTEX 3222]
MTFSNTILSESIYLDYHATTPVDRRVVEKVYDYMVNNFGNSSSIDHIFDNQATKKIKQSLVNFIFHLNFLLRKNNCL